ncbi:hypothetical protein [Asaccharospora irregularis]|uniref:Uncharacterized protein n=1 Tax=Asaccharospora irregularis DSM 2635 TaxID=1121321 RepID=A0A1M5NNX9_9FIRM|nr:hypothetical protein [Asaccharospora irregularis]SHG91232.1 hypothetical protein SAMN04488530_11129 [Asaccharospora irregularis DSM 2635]
MSFKDKFAESFARSKTMSEPEKKANEIMGRLLLKKTVIPVILMLIITIGGASLKLNNWLTLGINLVIAVATFFYIKNTSKNYQNFKPYVGNLISLEKKNKKEYVAIIKQGKLPVKLQIAYGGEDLENIKKNQLIQISYNPEIKLAILVNKQ